MTLKTDEVEKVLIESKKNWIENKKGWLKEIKDFAIMFVIIISFGWIFINAQLLIILFDNIFASKVSASDMLIASPVKKVALNEVKKDSKANWDDFSLLKEKIIEKHLDSKLNNLKESRTDMIYKPSYSSLLKWRLVEYHIDFNTLPPDWRVIVPKLWINVHMRVLTNIPIEKIKKADYDEYLYSGVVKYPYTANPGFTWNVFIFGHSSFYWWKNNPYGTIFAKLPALRHWDNIIVFWKWKIHKYRIFKKHIVWPYQVESIYKNYTKWKYLSLMTCYPIWSDRQRLVVVAEQIE